jgi:lysyl-tRNA synthetase class 2
MASIRKRLEQRQKLYAQIRQFFAERAVLEVQTPVLSRFGTTDPAIESFSVHFQDQQRWLRTSPEFCMKRLLAMGCGSIFELGPVFRVDEQSARHSAEFTMLEWYRVGLDELGLRVEVEQLLQELAMSFGRVLPKAVTLSFRSLFEKYAGLDPFDASDQSLRASLDSFGMVSALERDQLLDAIRALVIEPKLRGLLLWVTDFPPSQAALAKLKAGTPPTAARFELYLDGIELANGYQELTEAAEQRRRFTHDLAIRRARKQPMVAFDSELIRALASGMPECSGIALGADRLLMWLVQAAHIDEVLSLSFTQA